MEGSKTTSVKTKSELLPYSEGSNVLQPATDTRTFPFPNIRASTSVPSTKFGAPLWLMWFFNILKALGMWKITHKTKQNNTTQSLWVKLLQNCWLAVLQTMGPAGSWGYRSPASDTAGRWSFAPYNISWRTKCLLRWQHPQSATRWHGLVQQPGWMAVGYTKRLRNSLCHRIVQQDNSRATSNEFLLNLRYFACSCFLCWETLKLNATSTACCFANTTRV